MAKSKSTTSDEAVAADVSTSRKLWTEQVETELERLHGAETLLHALAADTDDESMKYALREVCEIVNDVNCKIGDAVVTLPAGGAS